MDTDDEEVATKSVRASQQRKKRKGTKRSAVPSHSSADIPSIMGNADITNSSREILREMLERASQFMRHAHRDKLTSSDVRKAMNFYEFAKTPTVDTTEDIDIDLASHENEPASCEEDKIFYVAEPLHCPIVDTDSEVDDNLQEYFKLTMKAVLCDDSELLAACLSDLKRNYSIFSLLPFFILSLCSDNTLLQYSGMQLKNGLQVLHSLYMNPNIYFRNIHLYKVLSFVLSCATNNLWTAPCFYKQNCAMRDAASEFLRDFFGTRQGHWNFLFKLTLEKLKNAFQNEKMSLLSCYGSLATINALGLKAAAHILPLMFVDHTNNIYNTLKKRKLHETENEAVFNLIDEKLLKLCKCYLIYHISELIELLDSSEYKIHFLNVDDVFLAHDAEDVPLNFNVCLMILDYFGERLKLYLPSVTDKSNVTVPMENIFKMQLQASIPEKTGNL